MSELRIDPTYTPPTKRELEIAKRTCFVSPCGERAFLNVEGYRYCLNHWAEYYESTKDEYSDGPMLLPEFVKLTTIY